jgi:hypothetical protein
MSDKTKAQTKADLLEMLAQAVRNTQPQPVQSTLPEPVRDVPAEPKSSTQRGKARPAPKRTAKIKKVRGSSSRKQRHR